MFNKKTVKDIDLAGKRVLLRADYNVPTSDGLITDDYRIKQSLTTVQYILEQKPASLIIISHLGRPVGKPDKKYSLLPVANRLGRLLKQTVFFSEDCVGEIAKQATQALEPGAVLLLENLRFHDGEEKNDPGFAKALVDATGAQVFVQDGFGVVHRAHASTEAITKLLPSVEGLLLEKEIATITKVMSDPARPLVAVIGGAKIADKIEVLNKFIDIADCLAVGGAMSNDFFRVERISVGSSLLDREALDMAADIFAKAKKAEKERNFSFLLPVDVVVSTALDGRQPTRIVDIAGHSLADIESYPKIPEAAASRVGQKEKILDIGPVSAGQIAGAVKLAQTVVWNGTLGVTEVKGINGAFAPFSHSTHTVVEAMIGVSNRHKNKAFTLVGGGDTAAYVSQQNLLDDFSFVSTGGGATLELMSGHRLPGVESLLDKPTARPAA